MPMTNDSDLAKALDTLSTQAANAKTVEELRAVVVELINHQKAAIEEAATLLG